ncbi:MAG TPA: hypothetical protein VF746_10820 [Longimicrobium sp.]|jgi:hypothetical protein
MYTVFVAENSAYMDRSAERRLGDFPAWDEAVAAARDVVERSLRELHAPPMDAEHLFRLYTLFGEDAYVVPSGEPRRFSAWDYARERSRQICRSPS